METAVLYTALASLIVSNLYMFITDRVLLKRLRTVLENSSRLESELANKYLELLKTKSSEETGHTAWLLDDSNGNPVRYTLIQPNEYFREHFRIRKVRVTYED